MFTLDLINILYSFPKPDLVVVQIDSFGIFIVSLWLYLFFSNHTSAKLWNIRGLPIVMELRNISVSLLPVHWMNYFFSILFLTEGLIGGGSKIPLLESIEVLTMSGKKIMWQASLVECDILLKVLVIFFLE